MPTSRCAHGVDHRLHYPYDNIISAPAAPKSYSRQIRYHLLLKRLGLHAQNSLGLAIINQVLGRQRPGRVVNVEYSIRAFPGIPSRRGPIRRPFVPLNGGRGIRDGVVAT